LFVLYIHEISFSFSFSQFPESGGSEIRMRRGHRDPLKMGFTHAKSSRYLASSRGIVRFVVMIEFERNIIFLIPRLIETPDLLGSFITEEPKSSQL
jgi:hypothetical protein